MINMIKTSLDKCQSEVNIKAFFTHVGTRGVEEGAQATQPLDVN